MREAKIILNEYDIAMSEEALEMAMDAVERFGSAKGVLVEGLKPQYMYLKKLSKLIAILNQNETFDIEAENIAKLLHEINKVVLRDSQSRGEDYLNLLRAINVRKTFNPTEMELWVMEYLGGRNLISKINEQEPNQLKRRIVAAIEKYKQIEDKNKALGLEDREISNQINSLIKRY